MIKHFTTIVLICLWSVSGALADEKQEKLLHKLDQSLTAWKAMKAKYGDSYQYTKIYYHYSHRGIKNIITVRMGKAKKPSEYTVGERYNYLHQTKKWLTIDQLYDECKIHLSKDTRTENFNVSLNKNGLLQSCWSSLKNTITHGGTTIKNINFQPVELDYDNKR